VHFHNDDPGLKLLKKCEFVLTKWLINSRPPSSICNPTYLKEQELEKHVSYNLYTSAEVDVETYLKLILT